MPTKREREYYRMGYTDGINTMQRGQPQILGIEPPKEQMLRQLETGFGTIRSKPKRKLSPWNKFVKANSKKPRFIYKSGSNKGKLNLKKMGVAFRKTPAGKKKK